MYSVTQVKKDDMSQGIAQCAVQLESAIYINRVNLNIEDTEEEETLGRAFRVVTDAERFHFLRVLTMNSGDTIRLEVLQEMTIGYRMEGWQDRVEAILGNIVWLLQEVEKPVNDVVVDSPRVQKGEVTGRIR